MGQLDKDQLAAGSVQLWSPHRALSGAKAPSFSLTRACTHTCSHTKNASMRVGLAEISLMTLGRENDASSSSHPEPSSFKSQSGNTPGTCHHLSGFSLACGFPLPVGCVQPGPKPQTSDKGLSGFELMLQNGIPHTA